MKHIVSFSGGRSSRYLVHLLEEKRKGESLEIEYIFMDTGAEHPKTYAFIKRVVEFYGISLTCLKPVFGGLGIGTTYKIVPVGEIGYNLDSWKAMLAKYSTPYNPSGGFCTDQLKGIPSKKYIKDHYKAGEYTEWWGIRADEPRRLKQKNGVKYLAELSSFGKNEIIKWSSVQDFDLDIKNSEVIGNCVFCIKRDDKKLAVAARLEPCLAKEWSAMLSSDKVRQIQDRKAEVTKIYRGSLSLLDITEKYKGTDSDILLARRGGPCTSACSDSCESVNSNGSALSGEMIEELQLDLFPELIVR